MSVDSGTPLSESSGARRRTTLIIVSVVVVLLLCCCCGSLWLAWTYGDAVLETLNELSQTVVAVWV